MEKTLLISMSVEEFQNIIIEAVNKCLAVTKQSQVIIESDEPEIMNIEQVSMFLHVSKATIYKWVMDREIPVSKKGKRLYFIRSELMEWVKTGKRKTNIEIDQEATNYIMRKKRK